MAKKSKKISVVTRKTVLESFKTLSDLGMPTSLEFCLIVARYAAGTQRKSDARRFTMLTLAAAEAEIKTWDIPGCKGLSKEIKKVLKKHTP